MPAQVSEEEAGSASRKRGDDAFEAQAREPGPYTRFGWFGRGIGSEAAGKVIA